MSQTHSETYKGTAITIVTAPEADGWISHALYALPGREARVETAARRYTSEDEARQAALQAAVESIDRARTFIGKP